jgi:hypothetical protein
MPFRSSRDDPFQHVGEPCQRLDAVEFRCLDQRADDRPMSSAIVRAGEQGVLASQCHWPHRPFDDIGIERGSAILEEHGQTIPVRQRITERLGDRGPARNAGELFGHPGMHRLDQWAALLLPHPETFFRSLATQIDFDRVKVRDAAQRLLRQRCLRVCRGCALTSSDL